MMPEKHCENTLEIHAIENIELKKFATGHAQMIFITFMSSSVCDA